MRHSMWIVFFCIWVLVLLAFTEPLLTNAQQQRKGASNKAAIEAALSKRKSASCPNKERQWRNFYRDVVESDKGMTVGNLTSWLNRYYSEKLVYGFFSRSHDFFCGNAFGMYSGDKEVPAWGFPDRDIPYLPFVVGENVSSLVLEYINADLEEIYRKRPVDRFISSRDFPEILISRIKAVLRIKNDPTEDQFIAYINKVNGQSAVVPTK